MEQSHARGFGRGWVPAGRDIGLPSECVPPHLLGPSGHAADGPRAGAGSIPGVRHDAFTRPRQVAFLGHLAQHGVVRLACQACHVSPQAAYSLRRRDVAFADGWDAALVLARGAAEQVLADRALNGVAETIFYRGEAVGARVRFDARLLLAHLARLDRHHDALPRARQAATGFDALLGALLDADAGGCMAGDANADAPVAPRSRAECVAAAEAAAERAFPDELADIPLARRAELAAAAGLDPAWLDDFIGRHAAGAVSDADADDVWVLLERAARG
ncbi:MAG: hypothetical protein RIS94_2442, partial [Pseudomonadota bacterium]